MKKIHRRLALAALLPALVALLPAPAAAQAGNVLRVSAIPTKRRPSCSASSRRSATT